MSAEDLRIGHGFDVHPYVTDDDEPRTLVLGGVEFPDEQGLVGHSDADVIAHACIDALVAACGLGDIGTFFPDSDPDLAGANSIGLLTRAVEELRRQGWAPVNVDCTIVADSPKLAPVRDQIEENLSSVVNAAVTIKGKRTEGLDGLAGGIQCHAVALVRRA